MKIRLKLATAIATLGLTLGIGAATAQNVTPCDVCYTNYQNCLAKGKSELYCYGLYSRCMSGSGCVIP